MPEINPRLTAMADQVQSEAREELARQVVRYHDRGWGFFDQLGEFLDWDAEALAVLLTQAVYELKRLSAELGHLDGDCHA